MLIIYDYFLCYRKVLLDRGIYVYDAELSALLGGIDFETQVDRCDTYDCG